MDFMGWQLVIRSWLQAVFHRRQGNRWRSDWHKSRIRWIENSPPFTKASLIVPRHGPIESLAHAWQSHRHRSPIAIDMISQRPFGTLPQSSISVNM
ncbi:hypothetical protein PISMIDRAFT_448428 [Pisolithus microcarpus 441]|uniref:Uncharacterized protein n=1 Tax=Pisolithus microcarpus 441 TaxID=765257 RepID=A0A0C9YY41_9AGAM|nr:hypothetical protein PISMIDRAFT_448428 [Pisolithus microcarpus 441]